MKYEVIKFESVKRIRIAPHDDEDREWCITDITLPTAVDVEVTYKKSSEITIRDQTGCQNPLLRHAKVDSPSSDS